MRKQVFYFQLKVLVFLIPILIFSSIPALALIFSGEIATIDSVAKKQAEADYRVVYGPAYTQRPFYYKLRSVQIRKPKVMVLGTSRVQQIRGGFFKKPDEFFNAAVGGAL